ncbi:MAG: hypothetical protein AMXMBFR83_25240 [Phycisphaerae bacterium]
MKRDPFARLERLVKKLPPDRQAAAREHAEQRGFQEAEAAVSGPLRQAIAESGLSVNAIATRAGVQQAALSRFVRRERGLTLETVDRLAAYLGLKLKPARHRRR